MFDAEGSTISELTTNIQSLACQTFAGERKNKQNNNDKENSTATLTTPNFEGLNEFLKNKMYDCISNERDVSNMQVVEGNVGFHIPNSYSLETIKRYCPNEN